MVCDHQGWDAVKEVSYSRRGWGEREGREWEMGRRGKERAGEERVWEEEWDGRKRGREDKGLVKKQGRHARGGLHWDDTHTLLHRTAIKSRADLQ